MIILQIICSYFNEGKGHPGPPALPTCLAMLLMLSPAQLSSSQEGFMRLRAQASVHHVKV